MLKGEKKMPSQWRQFDQSQTNMCTFCTSVRKRYWKPPLQRYEAPEDEVWGNLWPIASVLQTTMRFSYLFIWQLSILHSHSNASLGDFKLIWSAVRENTGWTHDQVKKMSCWIWLQICRQHLKNLMSLFLQAQPSGPPYKMSWFSSRCHDVFPIFVHLTVTLSSQATYV